MNKEYKEFKKYINDTMKSISTKINDDEIQLINLIVNEFNKICEENKELQEELQKADSITQNFIFDGKEESQLNYRKAIKTIEELHNKIDKAIEYLENDDNFWIPDSYSEDKVKMIQKELKQILKDSDVDE